MAGLWGWIVFTYLVIPCSALVDSDIVSVVWDKDGRNFQIKDEKSEGAVAWASFSNKINETGWADLEVYTDGSYDDILQAYAAGLAEAKITKQLLEMHWINTYKDYCTAPLSKYCQQLQTFLNDNLAWVTEMIAKHADSDPYWHQVQLFYEQMSGLIDGFNGVARFPSKYSMDVTSLVMLQISGDCEDLESALKPGQDGHVIGSGSCSALIKLLPDNEDLYVSQDTWNGYNSMLRILKKYDFQYHLNADSKDFIPGQVMTFSSYPGTLMSGDDFYTLSSGLVSIETTIGNSNSDLWKFVKPQSAVLEGIRNIAANRLASNAKQWVDVFSKFNSGTYNNQWMVVDYKQFKPGHPLPSTGVLQVLEQIPGMIVSEDKTSFLAQQTYWPSYNTPYFPAIFNTSGCWKNVHKYGDWFTYDHTPRANIFRRDHTKVKDIASMTRLMRYNDFTHDPLSKCNCTPPFSGENAISARCDLNPANGTYPFGALGHRNHGGTDMKLTTSKLAASLEFIAVSSPTYDDVPPFQWSKADFGKSTSHIGHPDLWQFKPVQHHWGSRP